MIFVALYARPAHAAVIIVNSNITANTTWEEGNVYVLDADIVVVEGAALTIEPGAVVKGKENTRLIVEGVLKAQGTAGNHVVFTSYKDDDHGGDTNGDGNASAPAPNDWGWVEFADSSVDNQNILQHCSIFYGGKEYWTNRNRYYGAVHLNSASPTISECTISDSGQYAISMNVNSFPTVTGNVFSDNGANGIGVYAGTMSDSGAWTSTNYPYVFDGDITVAEGTTLTIDPGVVVKGKENTRMDVYGVLKAQGSPDKRVVFTSYKDDDHGGDTNGDGNASAPAPNDWGWVQFNDSSVDDQSILEYCSIFYGGKDYWTNRNRYYGVVNLSNASPTISECTISDSGQYAISMNVNSFPTVTGNVFSDNGTNGIGVYAGTMSDSGAWTSTNYPYVFDGDITVAEGTTLTIDPGVVVKGKENTRMDVYGVLKAQGTPDKRVVFTSVKDDSHGGDTNNDGEASAAAPNDWGWVQFNDSSVDDQSILEYCSIFYGGKDYWTNRNRYYGVVNLSNASPTVSQCEISQNGQYAISMNANSFPTVTGNDFSGNGVNGIGIYEGTMSISGGWTSTNQPYVFDGDITVAEGTTLTIDPGVVVKGQANTRLIVQGVLKAQGTPDNHIVFTSHKDDTYGGDTNNDGNASAPAPNDWGWVQFDDSSVDDQSILEYCSFFYGGKEYWTNRNRYRASVTVVGAAPTIRNNIIAYNGRGIWTEQGALPLVTGNAIFANVEYGFYNQGQPLVVTAKNNWWGHESGPYDPSNDPDDPTGLYNPAGLGDEVSDYVDYDPWRTSPQPHPFIQVDGTIFLPNRAGHIGLTLPNGHPFLVSVPVNCGASSVSASFAGSTYALGDADQDNAWTAMINGYSSAAQTVSLTVEAEGGSCAGQPWEVAQIDLIEPNGYVYNQATNSRVGGAVVTLYRYDVDQQAYVMWDGYPWGQVNPQRTDDQGHFGWALPGGSYYFTVESPGYRTYQSSPTSVPPQLANANVALTPAGDGFRIYIPLTLR